MNFVWFLFTLKLQLTQSVCVCFCVFIDCSFLMEVDQIEGGDQVAQTALPLKITAEQLGVLQQGDEEEDQFDFDVGHMMVTDSNPLDHQAFKEDPNQACLEAATTVTQSLIKKLFSLPTDAAPMGRLAHLPEPLTKLPRAKPVPEKRPMTKWEKFAQAKGIVKRKKTKLLWDEASQSWKRRWGYKKADDPEQVPIIEAGPNDKVGEDPFEKMQNEKRARVKKQEKQQLKNLKYTVKEKGQNAMPATIRLSSTLPQHGKGKPIKSKEFKQELSAASKYVGTSTASMGKFDKKISGDMDANKTKNRKRKFLPVVDKSGKEKEILHDTIDRIISKHHKNVEVDVNKAINTVVQEERLTNRQKRKMAVREKLESKGKGGKKRRK
eukprot:TRINITY_DN29018_c0_g1_i1.p1 TRINITY_DN29018_c0_g1~~TRINITY_DN29018_c0_g1_i1.p1  ORF type:complete len:380 (-),score=61.26 TRINITY_DN29018_c0_g1_i1:327-1466(-)